ncbi:D-2-hydroxyglutarate dehydrogenase, mitochondrial-like [Pomacea canaliculata]|uniref:D-2-hydroxyglutarate dehydrogenase, mitochondrial-like n=1 Tax=Pomacea canaliculata TaxID=400727 RepID=UPI000D733D93|nr:D-2-hydroxyglutarate dehydrogenase, mitochondrial-like [Pomacea canaliculata]
MLTYVFRDSAMELSRCLLRRTSVMAGFGRTETIRTVGSSAAFVELTSRRYPGLQRGHFASLTDADAANIERLVSGRVLTDLSELEGYNMDWMKTLRGSSKLVVRPKSTEEVAAVLRYCNDRRLAVVPQGGNTGLVGGSIPVFDEIIISTQLMNNIINMDDVSGILVCQAGCVLGKLDDYVKEYGFTMPLDLGAKGSCHIGGNLATNAGGLRLLRYGSLHGNVLGLEVVLPNGEILDCLSTLRKDNTGYDLKQLFVGSEGTLGIITAASILCPQQPNAVNVALLGVPTFKGVMNIFKKAKVHLGEILSAFELMDRESMEMVTENLKLSNPITSSRFYALIETSGSNKDHDEEKISSLLETLLNSGQITDGTLATDESKIQAVWSLRERLAEGLLCDGYCYKYDVSLPLSVWYDVVEEMRKRLEGAATHVVAYGHVGDGNLHFNVTSPVYSQETMDLIEPYFYDLVAKYKGCVSAEHGLGFRKKDFIYHSKSTSAVSLMKMVKNLIDPKGIMNPYKLLPTK